MYYCKIRMDFNNVKQNVLVLIVLLFTQLNALGQNDIVLNCKFNIEREDGSPLPDAVKGSYELQLRNYLSEVGKQTSAAKFTDNQYKKDKVICKSGNNGKVLNFNFRPVYEDMEGNIKRKYGIKSISTDVVNLDYNRQELTFDVIVKENISNKSNTNINAASDTFTPELSVVIDPALKSKYSFNYSVIEDFINSNISSIAIGTDNYIIDTDNKIEVPGEIYNKLNNGGINYSIINDLYYTVKYINNQFVIGINENRFPLKMHKFSIRSYGKDDDKIDCIGGLTLYYKNEEIKINNARLEQLKCAKENGIFELPLIQNSLITYSLILSQADHYPNKFLTDGELSLNLTHDKIQITSESIEISQTNARLYVIIPFKEKVKKDFINAAMAFTSVDESILNKEVPSVLRLVIPVDSFKNNEYIFNPNDSIKDFDKTWEIVNSYDNKQQLVYRLNESINYHQVEVRRKGRSEKINLHFSGDVPDNIGLTYQVNTLDQNVTRNITKNQLAKGYELKCFLPEYQIDGEKSELIIEKPNGYNVELVGTPSDWKTDNTLRLDLMKFKNINSDLPPLIQIKFTKIKPFELFYLDLYEVKDLDLLIQNISESIGDRDEGFAVFLSNGKNPQMLLNGPDKLSTLYTIIKTYDFVVPITDVDTAALNSFIKSIDFYEEQRDINLHLVMSRVFYRNFQFENGNKNEAYESNLGDNAFQYYKNAFIKSCLDNLPHNKVKELNIYFGSDLYVNRLSAVKTNKDEFYQLIKNQNYLDKNHIKFKEL